MKKRRYLSLIVAIALTMALVLASGLFLREAVLRPAGLHEGTDPVSLPLRLLCDSKLREMVRLAAESLGEEQAPA